MTRIEPCPHCGGVSKVRKDGSAYFVRCEDCGATSGRIYKNGGVSPAQVQNRVIEKWNRRVGMTEHIALLEKELYRLRLNLDQAQRRAGVRQEEIDNLLRNIRIKEDLVNAMNGKKRCAVFTKMHATDYDSSPRWIQYCSWTLDEAVLRERLEAARENPRFAEAKVVAEVKMYLDLEGL